MAQVWALVQARWWIWISGFLYATSLTSSEYCEGTPWLKFQDNCYLFVQSSKGRVSYYDAEDFCRSEGAHLASIHSQEENDFILGAMKNRRLGGRLWIGYNTLEGENNPQWSDGTPVDYQNALPKQHYPKKKCYIMFLSESGWRSEHCALHYAPLCKRPAKTPPTTSPPVTTPAPVGYCPPEWIQFGQKCYKYFGAAVADRKKYAEARAECWSIGENVDLVSLHALEEEAFLTQNLYDLGTSAWIGMRQIPSDEIGHDLVFGWDDNSRTDFTYWAKGHPPPGTWKYCAYLRYEGVAKGEWVADYCDIEKRGYICQRPAAPFIPPPVPKPSKCKEGYVSYRNSCYLLIKQNKTQAQAEATCQELGGHLVSVVDGFEQAFLYSFLYKESGYIWTGLKNAGGTQYLKWSDGQPVYYTDWFDNQPHLSSTKDTCAFFDTASDLRWYVDDCDKRLPFVCKITNDSSPAFPEVLGTCPGDDAWIDIGDDFCYHVPHDNNNVLTWDTASRYCASKRMKMLRMYSEHQVNSLLAYVWNETRSVHLGLIRTYDKKSFMWVDGTPLEYTNWETREPSTWSSDKNCVDFSHSTGKWKVVDCSDWGITLCTATKQVLKKQI